jgi:hypothetical protein
VQPAHERALGQVPALAALLPQPAGAVVGEGQHLAVGQLAAGRVEVAAQDRRLRAAVDEVVGERFVGADLGEVG